MGVHCRFFPLALALVATPSAAADPPEPASGLELGANGNVGLERDDIVLYGPVTGYGFDAGYQLLRGWTVGGYVQWLNPTVFSESGDSAPDRKALAGGVQIRWHAVRRERSDLVVLMGAGYRRHTESSRFSDASLVSNGVDYVRFGIGYDWAATELLRLGLYYLWSTGCFHERVRTHEDGTTKELDSTCPGHPWVSNWVGVRMGAVL